MILSEKLIKDEFENILTEIKDELKGLNVVVRAIQLLLPDTHHFNRIQQFFMCQNGEAGLFNRIIEDFVYNGSFESDIQRSLFYLKFKDPFKYRRHKKTKNSKINYEVTLEIPPYQFTSHNLPVPINEQLKEELTKQENLYPFWTEWIKTLRNRSFGDSTLWTYILLRGELETIASAYVIFDGHLELTGKTDCNNFKKLSKINKQLQESLTRLSLELFNSAIANQATRALIAQIMARNVSHNIGSHVSYKATNIAIKKRISELFPNLDLVEPSKLKVDLSCGELSSEDEIAEFKQKFAEFLNELAEYKRKFAEYKAVVDWIDFMSEKLDKYEIHRNEYLADYSLSPQSFRFYKDVILPFCENTLILDNIASMEGANYPKPFAKKEDDESSQENKDNKTAHCKNNKLKVRVFIKKADEKEYKEIKAKYPDLVCLIPSEDCSGEIVYPDNFPYLLKNKEHEKSLSEGINSKEIVNSEYVKSDLDVEVLLHSEQGLYSILENFIRNSAKHNKVKIAEKGGLKIRLHLEEDEEKKDRFKLILSDNVSKLKVEELFNDELNNPGLYQRIKSGVITDTEQSGKQNLGFADMNINSFLFKKNASDISNDSLTENLQLVTISPCEDCKESCENCKTLNSEVVDENRAFDKNITEFNFGYQIELLKPRKVLWIGDDVAISNKKETKDSFKSNGIFQFKNVDEYENSTENKGEIAAFDFVVFNKTFNYDNYLKSQIHLPPRVLVVPKNGEEKYDKPNIQFVVNGFEGIKDSNDLFEKCWVEWLNRIDKPKKAYIYYEDNEDAENKLENLSLGGNNVINYVKKIEGNNENLKKEIIDNKSKSIIYDHHGKATYEEDNYQTNLESPLSTENFYTHHAKIFFDKGSDDYVTLNSLPTDEIDRKLLAYRLINAATTNIFVLDERIATVANREFENKNDNFIGKMFDDYDRLNFSRFCYGKVFTINNITINDNEDEPIHTGDQNFFLSLQINSGNISLKISNEAEWVLSELNELPKDVLVIHRTYLKNETLGMEVEDFFNLANEKFGSVIVTSGGGYPHNLPEKLKVRFVPFSIIEQCINSRLSKLKLVTYLQKLRYVK